METAHVLVVDDIDFNIELTTCLLKSLPIEVIGANSGQKALQALAEHEFALILMDVQMPEMNGFECVSKIRECKKWRDIPVIFITACSSGKKYTGEGYRVGAVDYLLKPVDADVLQGKVKVFVDLFHRQKKLERAFSRVDRVRRKNELLLNYTTEYTSEGILGLDLNHCVTFANHAACKLLAKTKELLAGTSVRNFFAPLSSDDEWRESEFVSNFHACRTSEERDGLFWRSEEESFPVEFTQATIIDNGQPVGSVVAFQDISDRKEIEKRLVSLARYDQLTGLSNRSVYWENLTATISRAQRYQGFAALLFIDLDEFKKVNDNLGHESGDFLLIMAAERIRQNLRESDLVCRMGGDEFAVVISNPKDAQEAAMVGEKILSALKGSFAVNHHEVYIGASIGIALYPENGTDAASLTKAADTAMYCAKESGRNQYQFYSDDMQQRIKHQMQIANDLRIAIDTDQLELYYQPQIDLKNGRLKRMEALLRWYHPERGMIGPSVFVPIAENTGLIHQLGEWAFLRAMEQMRKWLNEFGSQMRIPLSLNASSVQLKGGSFSNNFVALLKSQKLPPGVIDLELTETALMEQSGEAIEELAKIRAAGTKVLVDDFGTGYSSLSYLKQLSVDVLKVDSSFVRDIGKNTGDEAIVQAIINLAHNLGMTVAAEGVESHLQCDFVRRQGCDFAQGYYFNHPVEAGKATQLIARDLSLH